MEQSHSKNQTKGIVYTILSAAIFGFAPILGKLTFAGGSNAINLVFLRATLSLPILYLLLRRQRIPLQLTEKQGRQVALTGILGTGVTTLTLYAAYDTISVGMATTLHFIYPVLVTVGCIFLYREKLSLGKLLALLLGTGGIFFFLEPGGGAGLIGIALSIFSGFTYAFYILYMDKSGLKGMYYFKLSFYLNLGMAATAGLYGLWTKQLTFALTPTAWFYSLLVSVLTSVFAITLFQIGISLVGASTASILCTAEPITSVILGVLLLGETLSPIKLVGCACILLSVVLITLADKPRKSTPIQEEIV